jgi:hypothetical protein
VKGCRGETEHGRGLRSRALPADGDGTIHTESDEHGTMATMLDTAEDTSGLQEGQRGAIGQDEVDAGGAGVAFGVCEAESPRERRRQKGDVDVAPGSSRAKQR